jgi:transcriptional regulator with XRE-family HTH domain
MDDRIEIGKRIRLARKARGLKQADVSKHLGIDRVNVTQWESGDTAPARERLPVLADLLDVDVSWILTGKGRGPGAADKAFDALVAGYPEHLKAEAEKFLRYLLAREETPVPPAFGTDRAAETGPAKRRR